MGLAYGMHYILATRQLEPAKPKRYHMDTPIGDSIPELILTNSHNGSSAFNIMAGLYRTREVGSVNENLRINKALWQLAEEMRKIKAG